MGLFGVLIFSFGAFCVATATECVPGTAKCSEYWERILPHKNLISSEAELNSWCSKQARFYQCLEDVLLEGKNGNLSYLPTNLLISKLFSQDLCSEGSKSRTRLLNSAECINQLNTDFCILPEYLDIVTPDDDIPSTRCSQAEKTFSCIAATMVLNCGFDAGRVYRTMLKITRYSDEVCAIETSEGIPPCEGGTSKSVGRDKLSEIYYGLFHRMGDVLDPVEQDEMKDSTSDVPEESENADEMVTETIQTAIDNLEENLISEELDIEDYLDSKLNSQSVSCSKDVKEYKPHMQNPTITEIFKEFLFYNYSGMEYALYWRQPLFSKIDRMDCKQLQPSYMKAQIFRCKFDFRKRDPDCVSNATVLEKVTPEFIRSFDPEVPCDSTVEFGPRPEWMSEIDQMYEDKKIREQTKSSEEAPVATKASEAFTTCSTLLNLAASVCPEATSKWYEVKFEDFNVNAPIPNELYYEIRDLVWPDLATWKPPATNQIRIGDSQYFIMYNPEFAKSMENITCSRINECDPRGRGLWKCKVWPRQIETCDTCDISQTEDPFIGIQIYARPAKEREADFKVIDKTEPTVTVDESGMLHSSTPFIEPISLVFSGDAESENKIEADQSENELNEFDSFLNDEATSEDKLDNVDIDEMDKVEYNLVSDSEIDEIQLQILNSILNEGEDSEVVYAIEGTDTEDGESQVIIATEDGHLSGNFLVIKNLSDLGDSRYTVVTVPTSEAI